MTLNAQHVYPVPYQWRRVATLVGVATALVVAGKVADVPLAAAVVLGAAGCGGGDGKDRAGTPAPAADQGAPPPGAKTRVRVVEGLGRGGRFDPTRLYKSLGPGVVTVVAQYASAITPGGGRGQGALGSGFVLDSRGDVATNAHVVRADPPKLAAPKAVYVEFSDGNRVQARVVGTDPFNDVALLRIDPRGLTLTPLSLGTTRGLEIGDPVAAIGSPFGEQQSLSVGVVSALHRSIDSLTNFKIGDAIQTDAAINHGNSGGPLLDERGKVIGINSQIESTGGGGEGVGFAIPVESVRRSLAQLRTPPHVVKYAYLGVVTQDLYPQLARRLRLPVERGALVVKVEANGPAKDAGIGAGSDKISFQGQNGIPSNGDAIVSIDGRPVRDTGEVGRAVAARRPGQQVRIGLVHGSERRTVTVVLGVRPTTPAKG
jgi:S1-C subfamily serine protease